MATTKCLDDPSTIFKQKMCLNSLSKNLKGTLRLSEKEEQKCSKPECLTLKTVHALKLGTTSHEPCESKLGRRLNGTIEVKLVTAFDQDGNHRGFHAGDFEWSGSGFRAAGRMSGMTNVGTHRKPIFTDCQPCDARGFMEGRICGQVTEAKTPELKGCQIVGSYRIKFDPSVTGGSGSVQGVMEAVLICPCK